MKAFKIIGLSVLFAAAAAYAQDGVMLKYSWKKGAVAKTRMKGTLEFGGQEISVNILNQEKVLEVGDDGSATVEQSVVSLIVNMGGQEQDMTGSSGGSIIAVYNPDGSVKELRGENIEAGAYRMQNLMAFIQPKESLKVGSKWSKEVAADKDRGTPAYKGEYSVIADEKVGKWDTLKIKYKISESEGTDPASMEGTFWVSKEDASLIKGEATWANVPMAGAPFPISGKFSSMRED
jgi:hypothetical protein